MQYKGSYSVGRETGRPATSKVGEDLLRARAGVLSEYLAKRDSVTVGGRGGDKRVVRDHREKETREDERR